MRKLPATESGAVSLIIKMKGQLHAVLYRMTVIVTLLLLAGCLRTLQVYPATTGNNTETDKASLAAEHDDYRWWQLRFRLSWPKGEEVEFSRHLLIAEQLLHPVILEYEARLALWRFHRRAARDDAGHQFSLIFFSNQESAQQIYQSVTQQPLSLWLEQQGMIEKIQFSNRSKGELGALEQTSDSAWPMEIQRSWPYFIMGVSQTWLMLLQQISAEQFPEQALDYPALLTHYRSVDQALTLQWQEFGQHAYLHHLNAVFGYEPLRIRSSVLRSF